MVDFELDERFWRGLFRFLGRALLFLLEFFIDLFTFWEPWDQKRARRNEKKKKSDQLRQRSV